MRSSRIYSDNKNWLFFLYDGMRIFLLYYLNYFRMKEEGFSLTMALRLSFVVMNTHMMVNDRKSIRLLT